MATRPGRARKEDVARDVELQAMAAQYFDHVEHSTPDAMRRLVPRITNEARLGRARLRLRQGTAAGGGLWQVSGLVGMVLKHFLRVFEEVITMNN